MKKLFEIMMVVAMVAFATAAFAATTVSKIPFVNISAASAATKTSAVYNVSGYKNKTLQVSGVTLNSSVAAPTFKNMSGTLTAESGPSASGPWTTSIANEYGQTAVSKTTNGVITWTDVTPYVRFKWISGTVGGKLKVWFNYLAE